MCKTIAILYGQIVIFLCCPPPLRKLISVVIFWKKDPPAPPRRDYLIYVEALTLDVLGGNSIKKYQKAGLTYFLFSTFADPGTNHHCLVLLIFQSAFWIFTKSTPRPIQSCIHNIRLSVPPPRTFIAAEAA